MSDQSRGRKPYRDVTSGEILIGLTWLVFYGVMIASGWAHDAMALVASLASAKPF
jgi:hypothetical protein